MTNPQIFQPDRDEQANPGEDDAGGGDDDRGHDQEQPVTGDADTSGNVSRKRPHPDNRPSLQDMWRRACPGLSSPMPRPKIGVPAWRKRRLPLYAAVPSSDSEEDANNEVASLLHEPHDEIVLSEVEVLDKEDGVDGADSDMPDVYEESSSDDSDAAFLNLNVRPTYSSADETDVGDDEDIRNGLIDDNEAILDKFRNCALFGKIFQDLPNTPKRSRANTYLPRERVS